MSQQPARRVSWSIGILSFLLVMIGLGISIHAQTLSGKGVTFSHQFFTPLMTITYCVVGALVASRHPRNPIGWMFCTIGFFSALNMLSSGYALYSELSLKSDSLPGANLARWLTFWIWIPNILFPITFLLLLFPDGKLLSARWRSIALAAGFGLVGITGSIAFHPGPLENMGFIGSNPYGISGGETVINALLTLAVPLLLIGVFGSIASIIVRFRRAVGIERMQLRWLAVAGVLVIVGNILGGIFWWLWGDNPIAQELSIVITDITIVNIVIATGVAILRYRLWDIHIIVNRTLVFGSLTAIVIGIYVIIVGSLGMLLQTGGSLPISLLGTGIIAVLFQPLRERLQRSVNRLMYGERDDPYAVLGRLSAQLEVVAASQSVLPTLVETVAEALKLPYVAISLKEGNQFATVAEYNRSSVAVSQDKDDLKILPLIYQLETIGQLLLVPRASGETFSQTDLRLLETIARQAGVAAYNVRLTQDLQHSRERLVTTREEERRRLRRDLHDGLGPVLATIAVGMDAIRNLADNPEATRTLATEIKAQAQAALEDIRRIAYDLRPPILDEFGLIGALKHYIESINQSNELQITFEHSKPLSNLPAAIEVAVYRIALEALTNVQRHAQASKCLVRVWADRDISLEIADDGRGIAQSNHAGVGLHAMRERAAELGGMCTIQSRQSGGTAVLVQLPLQAQSIQP